MVKGQGTGEPILNMLNVKNANTNTITRNALQNGYFHRPLWKMLLEMYKECKKYKFRLGCKDNASGNNVYCATEIEFFRALGVACQYIDCLNHQNMTTCQNNSSVRPSAAVVVRCPSSVVVVLYPSVRPARRPPFLSVRYAPPSSPAHRRRPHANARAHTHCLDAIATRIHGLASRKVF